MIAPVASASLISGLNAQTRVAETAAANIANVSTDGYQAERGELVSRPLQGAAYVPLPAEGGVDLAREVVALTVAKTSFEAMARAYSTITETEKTGLNSLA
ncbi:flagellar basal body protein [Magnetospirillum molischianum]|uniref:Flagellar basal body rod protein N-terminal domain-containing protein n=1 Tax=Magnetospirillum molischianum DSM 120 TaxID=1150626 RepID=H8FU13_MAGML|nr:flagellar basal body protein [Magnetospirillum molischianum]CCG41851.1 conserved exported hypothetical protein [Magnetospirillum molischianum DSM 120]